MRRELKDRKTVVSEYVRNLSEDDLKFLSFRLHDRIASDLPEALNYMSRNRTVDEMMRSADSAFDLYDLSDRLTEAVLKECKKRQIQLPRELTYA